MRSRLSASVLIMVSACTWEESAPTVDPRAGNPALGIAQFRVDEHASSVAIIGLDHAGGEIAKVEVARGHVEEDLDGLVIAGEGRTLTANLRDARYRYQSIGEDRIHLTPPDRDHDLQQLLLDPVVTHALARWDFSITAEPELELAVEAPPIDYAHGGLCSSGNTEWNKVCGSNTVNSTPTNCCLEHFDSSSGNFHYPQTVTCPAGGGTVNGSRRACFSPPTCSSGVYGESCSEQAVTCISPLIKYEYALGNWQCKTPNSGNCPNKGVGIKGCTVCDGPNNYSLGGTTTSYNAGTDTCGFLQQPLLTVTKLGAPSLASTYGDAGTCGAGCTTISVPRAAGANVYVGTSGNGQGDWFVRYWNGIVATSGIYTTTMPNANLTITATLSHGGTWTKNGVAQGALSAQMYGVTTGSQIVVNMNPTGTYTWSGWDHVLCSSFSITNQGRTLSCTKSAVSAPLTPSYTHSSGASGGFQFFWF